uniref:Putative leucine-rich repeat receptor-like serine/threonine-protein kinase At5g15730 isoform X2 n=1 Tax=Rhizophora mucronata TaxID=61149 RepID=A0A2P2MU46_RHIMU
MCILLSILYICKMVHILLYLFFQGYTKSYPKFYDYLVTRFIWPHIQSCDV